MSVVIETTLGDLTVDLFIEERPIACLNFLKLCKLKYYNYNLFHTVEQGFIAQTGDPTGAGDGGSSIWGVVEGKHKRFFEAELLPKIYHTGAGLLSLVSAGKGLVGSQFYFTLGENLSSLDGVHCVIGEVVEGHETLRKLNEAIVDDKFRPYQDIRITHTVILDDPYPDPRGFQVPSRSPSPTPERMQNGRIAADEDIDDTNGMTLEEVQEMLAEREAKARATILEIVGDLPDADCAPPENVLFVCKLNPVTTDDDLEIIFSRFGKVKCCEVIRDKQTGDSLQYAFVEFEDQKSCETAYFKMDNVLIDDRRIHVDFSQSVARVKWRGKGRGVEGQSGRLDFNNLRSKPDNYRRSGGGGERGANDNGNGKERPRLTSEERRKAREERHREQEGKSKNRSRSRSRERRNNYRDESRRRDYEKERGYRNNGNQDRRRNDYYEERDRQRRDREEYQRKGRSRSRSTDRRERRRSVERRPRDVRNERRRSRSYERESRTSNRNNSRNEHRPHQEKDSRRDMSSLGNRGEREVQKGKDKRVDEKHYKDKRKTKRTRRSSSSDSTSSADSEDGSSTSSSSSSSSSESSSEDERRRKKKSSKTKKKQKPTKHKKKTKKQRK